MTVAPAVSDFRSASPVNMASAITAAPALVPPTVDAGPDGAPG